MKNLLLIPIFVLMLVSAVWARQCLAQQSYQTAEVPPVQGEMSDDSLRMWADKVASYARKTPQEIVSVHMDNTCYFLGDTIWYKAYVVREGKMIPSDISGVLYAELLNQDGYLVERQMLRLRDGEAHGSFCIPDTAYAGYYELRAYTRWQLNWGVYQHPHSKLAEKWFLRKDMAKDFFRDYDKLYRRVFPVFNKPYEAGVYHMNMSPRPLRRVYSEKEKEETAIVNFYPEGGNWVEGGPQEIAFEANSEKGKHLSGHLSVMDKDGNVLAEADTENRGRGTLMLQGRYGQSYEAVFTWGEGRTVKQKMPECCEQGIILSAKEDSEKIMLALHREKMNDIPLGLTIMVNGRLVHRQRITEDRIEIPTCGFPTGTAQLTIYDVGSRIWADRLLFIHHDSVRLNNISITGTEQAIAPYERREIRIKGPASGNVSVALYDSNTSVSAPDNGNLLTETILGSQIKGFVENPLYYFEESDSVRNRHLDLLLRVQGWRRYRWEEMTGPFTLSEPYEITPVIRGDMSQYSPFMQEDYFYHYPCEIIPMMKEQRSYAGICGPKVEDLLKVEPWASSAFLEEGLDTMQFFSTARADPADYQSIRKLKKEGVVHIEIATLARSDNQFAEGNVHTTDGRFAMQLPHADSPYFLYLIGADEEDKAEIRQDADNYPEFSVRIRPFFPRYVKPYDYYHTTYREPSDTLVMEKDSRYLREVTVKTNRKRGLGKLDLSKPVITVDAYEAFNQTVDAGLSTAWYAGSLSYTLNLARLFIGEMGMSSAYDVEQRWNGRGYSVNISSSELYMYNHLKNMQQVRIYTDYAPRLEGDPRYEASNQPSITINLEKLPDNMQRTTYRDRRYVMNGYNVCEDFYHPHYEQRPLPSHADYRRTLYWNPNLALDANGEATITLWGNSRECQPVISVEGITSRGEILSGGSR